MLRKCYCEHGASLYARAMAVVEMKPKNAVESLREIVQDLLVPELKAIKVELDSQRRETQTRFDSLHTELKVTTGALRAETEALRVELRLRDDKQSQALQAISDKMGTLMEVRERLAVLEAGARRA